MINPDNITMTKHAEAKTSQRGILRPTIIAVIMNGTQEPGRGNTTKYSAFGYTVVACGGRVVTAYERNDSRQAAHGKAKKAYYSVDKRGKRPRPNRSTVKIQLREL